LQPRNDLTAKDAKAARSRNRILRGFEFLLCVLGDLCGEQELTMSQRTLESPDALKDLVGQEIAVTSWFNVTQERIQQFADATLDHQWIHVDVDRARRESPFKAPIAHGFLTLSLLPHFMHEALQIRQGVRLGVNYGLNRVRFVSPVPAGSNIRARIVLQSLKDVQDGMEAVFNATVELEGGAKPACVAEWVARYYR
jgi:acyl dehydratase